MIRLMPVISYSRLSRSHRELSVLGWLLEKRGEADAESQFRCPFFQEKGFARVSKTDKLIEIKSQLHQPSEPTFVEFSPTNL